MRAHAGSSLGFGGRYSAHAPASPGPRSALAIAAWIAVAVIVAAALWVGLRKWSEAQVILPDPRLLESASAAPLDPTR